jgi:glycosyltransferase involved in cell wall biosynthesis
MSFSNSRETLADSIRSIVQQSYQNWELILLNDGSDDGSLEVAVSFADDRIRLSGDGCRRGLATRLNEAIDLSEGDYIARMDADDIAYPERLAAQVYFLASHPEVDLVGSQALVFRNDGLPLGLLTAKLNHDEICSRPWSGFHLSHPTWMGKREWFKRYRYDPKLLKSQDQDMLLRSYPASRFAAISQVLLGYRQHSLSISKILYSRFYFSCILVKRAWQLHRPVRACLCVLEQLLKAMVEVITISTGLSRVFLRHRTLPATEKQIAAWNTCWLRLHDGLKGER